MTGKEIKTLRQSLGLSQEDFARKLFTTAGTVSRWERNKVTPIKLCQKELSKIKDEKNSKE
ncbi:helix-turn-helix domain-containing protein [Candidatus Pacearchaeota archaeon]|nr:helix-turn-helix domain-containing protein [Candidatus Pacearchaeota archaeon]